MNAKKLFTIAIIAALGNSCFATQAVEDSQGLKEEVGELKHQVKELKDANVNALSALGGSVIAVQNKVLNEFKDFVFLVEADGAKHFPSNAEIDRIAQPKEYGPSTNAKGADVLVRPFQASKAS